MPIEQVIFKNASTTYYWSATFLPRSVRRDVFRLYSFVRVADDYVDHLPQQKAKFRQLRQAWQATTADPHFATAALPDDTLEERVIKNIVHVQRRYALDEAWVVAFLDAMQADLDGKRYETLEDTLAYAYGSAEVIGLMMAKLLNLSPTAYEAAKMQGRAMQYINFIRDVHEDHMRGRCYFPRADLERFGLPDLSRETACANRPAFRRYIRQELDRYGAWQTAASEGFAYLPRRLRIAVKTAADMYLWTGAQIARDPHVVFEHSVKPTRARVLRSGVANTFSR